MAPLQPAAGVESGSSEVVQMLEADVARATVAGWSALTG